MKLHENKDDFLALISNIHKRTGYRSDVIEKDYYVFLFLQEIAILQKNGVKAYFKGGTALYKTLKTTNRFSEDIDLSVDVRGLESRTQKDKMLERATKKFESLKRDSSQGFTHKSEVEAIYKYDPVTTYDDNDELQRFGKLKVEGTSFTISEPVEDVEVSTLIYDLATPKERKILEDKYNIHPFLVKTISLERIFVDKLFAAEAYVRKSSDPHKAFEAAKHIYDLSILKSNNKIKALYQDEKMMKRLLDIRLEEELNRLDGIPNILPKDFVFFDNLSANKDVQNAYAKMQQQYVYKDSDRISFEESINSIKSIKESLSKNKSWVNAKLQEKQLEQDEPEAENEMEFDDIN